MTVPSLIRTRYNVVSGVYRARGWEVPTLPDDIYAAQNVLWDMVARINNRTPMRVTKATGACIVETADNG